ncbi:MAG: PHP domain-containing protein [Candidatus Howiella sp.]|jgi:hypothetical protein
MSYLFETHYHTPVTSHCGSVPAEEAIPKYIEHGYAGICVTDHYYRDWFYEEAVDSLSWEKKIDKWLKGYDSAVKAAEGTGFRIILGMELRFTDNLNDHLVYGIDRTFLVEHPELYNLTPTVFRRLADQNGLFFAQAHPFRSMCSPRDPKDLHGVEVFNGNGRHNSHNDTAEAFAETNHLVRLSGSDFHEWEDLCTGGIYLERLPQDSAELARMLLNGEISGLKIPGQEKE